MQARCHVQDSGGCHGRRKPNDSPDGIRTSALLSALSESPPLCFQVEAHSNPAGPRATFTLTGTTSSPLQTLTSSPVVLTISLVAISDSNTATSDILEGRPSSPTGFKVPNEFIQSRKSGRFPRRLTPELLPIQNSCQ